jgi:RNA polymerase sigma factor (sigma-70 family)
MVYERREIPDAAAVTSMQRDLVEQAIRGDADAFTQLVRASTPRLHGVANLILRDPDRAKDAVQEAFIAAWRDMRALRDPDAWDAWLRRLTVRTCYRLAKKDRRRTQIEVGVTPIVDDLRASDASADVADREWVLSELGRLGIDQRSVITLHYYLDLPMREVAEILDIPFGTAASRLHRGLEVMRAAMREHPVAANDLATERSA